MHNTTTTNEPPAQAVDSNRPPMREVITGKIPDDDLELYVLEWNAAMTFVLRDAGGKDTRVIVLDKRLRKYCVPGRELRIEGERNLTRGLNYGLVPGSAIIGYSIRRPKYR